jgi:drug/metabolite transporter (DMT)-like permease
MSATSPAPFRRAAAQWAYPALFVLLWSTGFIGAKFGLPDAGPLTFLSWRYAAVLLLMGAVVLWARAPWPRAPRAWLHIGVSGLLVHGVYLGGVFTAIGRGLPAGLTALVVGLQPLLTALGASLLLGERLRPPQWLGLGLGLAGVGLVVAQKAHAAAGAPLLRAAGAGGAGAAGHHRRHAVPEALLPRLRPAHRRADPVRALPGGHAGAGRGHRKPAGALDRPLRLRPGLAGAGARWARSACSTC